MGNYACCMPGGMKEEEETIELVMSGGTVRILEKPVIAGKIMQEFPRHFICHSHSLYIGQKTPSLFPDEHLEVGNMYFLLPQHFFQSALTLVLLASLISPALSLKHPITPAARMSASVRCIERVSALCQPFEIEISDVSGGIGIRVSDEFITKLLEDGRPSVDKRTHAVGSDSADDKRMLLDTPQFQKDYERLVRARSKRWRPKLESIKEREEGNCQKLVLKICELFVK